MSDILLDGTAEELRALAAAVPPVRARPDLAREVLDRARRQRRSRRLRRLALGVGGGVVVVSALAAATLLGRGDHFTVTQPSTAMESTVRVEERVVFDRTLRPERGDVVLARLTVGSEEFDSMLRVVALPGDTVGCPADQTGRCPEIVVNGVPVWEDYLAGTVTESFPTTTVPAGRVFLLGDNRPVANDSRVVGPVELADVSGVAVRIRDGDGRSRPVPGAPAHDGPGDNDVVDPAGPVPPARATPA
ncbi:signal peptidase I [Plantactinospora sp. B5E13]|uniref:signal peptidase I n=1 Tax=Plantactinospora sp. B5E13 TaxID=3153758 RepID=UPI00325E0338